MAPVDEEKRPETEVPPSSERRHLRAAAVRARAKQLAERAQAEREHHSSLDAVFEIVDTDVEVGGGIIAGALSFRLFLWLLPLALVFVGGPFGLGLGVIQVFAIYLLAPFALAKQGTYGVLGVAAALLLGLFILGRLIVAAAEINATLWQRQTRKGHTEAR